MTIGIAEYMKLKKASSSSPERNIQGIQTIMALNAKNQDPYGMSGLANLPLSYALGSETRAAADADAEAAAQAAGYMDQQLQMERDKAVREERKLALDEANGVSTRDYHKSMQIQSLVKSAIDLSEKGQEGAAIKLVNSNKELFGFGAPIESFKTTPAGIQTKFQGKDWWQFAPDGNGGLKASVWDASGQWRQPTQADLEALSKPESDKPTGNVVLDKTSPTGYSYLSEQGNMFQGAPDPTKAKERTGNDGGSGSGSEGKEFRQWTTKLDGLKKSEASIQKGYDPITGQIIPQTQIDQALRTVRGQIADTENYIATEYPDQWGKYRKPAATTEVKKLDANTAKFILENAGGDKELARKMAREQGYSF